MKREENRLKVAKFREKKKMLNAEAMQIEVDCVTVTEGTVPIHRKGKKRKETKRNEERPSAFMYSVSNFVRLSREDYKKLREDYPTKDDIRWAINRLDAYIDTSDRGKKYKDHRAVLRKGNWVHNEFLNRKKTVSFQKQEQSSARQYDTMEDTLKKAGKL